MKKMEFEVLHVHRDFEKDVPCEFVECTDMDNGDVLLVFRCKLCQAEVAIQIKNKGKES